MTSDIVPSDDSAPPYAAIAGGIAAGALTHVTGS